jgi:hypothetical protein
MSSPSPFTIKTNDIIDRLDTVLYLNNAMMMAASDSGLTSDATNAMQALAIVIEAKLLDLKGDLEEPQEIGQ